MSANLPVNPSLEHLRNQAKVLLKAYRLHDPDAMLRVEAFHPHAANRRGNRENAFPCRLSDTLLVIAREYGFPSWTKLKSHVEAIAGKQAAPVAGKVVTSDGSPVHNATVFWIERTAENRTVARSTVTTDAEGWFDFAEVPPKPGEERWVTLLAQVPEGGVGFRNLPRTPQSGIPLTLTLQPTTTLRVTFTDAAGQPVAPLRVRISLFRTQNRDYVLIPAGLPGCWAQQTDARGECVFPGLPQGAIIRFAIEEEAFATPGYEEDITLTQTATPQAASIRLLPGGSVQGRVTQEDGQPVAAICVGAQARSGGSGGQVYTDASGNYRIAQLRSGVYNLMLHLRGEQEKHATARAIENVEVKPGATLRNQDFILIPGSLLTGKVIDKSTGQPIAGVMIGIYGPAHPRATPATQTAVTGPDGIYRARVPAGQQYVYVMGLSSPRYQIPQEPAQVTLGEDTTLSHNFALLPAIAPSLKPIRGRVVGPDGKLVANASLHVRPVHDSPMHSRHSNDNEADASGNFSLELPVASAWLSARSGALATAKAILAQGGEEITLRLEPNVQCSLAGQIITEENQPIANAKVILMEWRLDTGVTYATTMTDALGGFAFTALFSDVRYSVMAEAVGYGCRNTPPTEYKPGEDVDLSPLALPHADSFVAGRVLDAKGAAVVRQAVRLQGNASKFQETFTDAEGRFRFDAVVREPLSVYLYDDFNPSKLSRCAAGDSEVLLVRTSPQPRQEPQDDSATLARRQRATLLHQPGPALQTAAWLNTSVKMPDGLKNKIVLIDFWAISCGPCVTALPAVQKLSEQFSERDVMVVGLHAAGIAPAVLLDFIRAHKLTYPIAIDQLEPSQAASGQIMRAYGVQGIPMVAVLDRDGTVCYLEFGLEGAAGVIGNLLANER